MERVEAAIVRTVLYADVFDFPMTIPEIHHFLIHDTPLSLSLVTKAFETSPTLKELLRRDDGYVTFADRQELIALRVGRERSSQKLWTLAMRYGTWMGRLPFVRMVALTGALAVRNAAADDDDLDYLVVTQVGRVWLARAFAILLVRLGRLRGVEICPNYILAEDSLIQDKQDVFMAHEVVQMVPLYGFRIYEEMRQLNTWVTEYLPNADGTFHATDAPPIGRIWGGIKDLLEILLGGRLGTWLENWEYRRKMRRFQTQMQTPHSSAQLDERHVKGHFDDHGHPALQQYHRRLRELGVEPMLDAVPGD
jgi:hypothetical protein